MRHASLSKLSRLAITPRIDRIVDISFLRIILILESSKRAS
jgi:hypothetical protein